MDSKVYKLPENVTIEQVGRGVEGFLRNEKGLTVQGSITPEGYYVQAKSEDDAWKKISGMDQAVQVQLMPMGDSMNVQVGNAKWASKVGAGVAGYFLFAPLAVTAGIGAYKQSKLPAEIFAFIEKFLVAGGRTFEVGMSAPIKDGTVPCPSCGSRQPEGTKFCMSCGKPLGVPCPSCGELLSPGTRFCPKCGTPVTDKAACSACGEEIDADAKFCPKCGAQQA